MCVCVCLCKCLLSVLIVVCTAFVGMVDKGGLIERVGVCVCVCV